MKKYRLIICNLVCITCLFLLPQGCDSKSEAPATPKVVRKKIVGQLNMQAASPKAENIRISKTQKAAQPAPPETSKPVVVARKDTKAIAQKPKAAPTAPPKRPWNPNQIFQERKSRLKAVNLNQAPKRSQAVNQNRPAK